MKYDITSEGQKVRIYERLHGIALLVKVLIGLVGILIIVTIAGFIVSLGNDAVIMTMQTDTLDQIMEVRQVEPVDTAAVNPITKVTPEAVSLGEFTITHYSASLEECGKTDGITATGTKATAGHTIAVDPDVIPLGSQIIIDGVTYTAEDVGGAIKGKKIDIFVDSREEAIQRGKIQREIRLAN